MIEVNTAKRLLMEILDKGREYCEYVNKLELITNPPGGLSPSEKLLKSILWLILPVSVFLFALAVNGFYIDNADWWMACGIVVSFCTIPSLVYLLRYTKNKVTIKNLENKMDSVSPNYEYKKKLLKKEIKKIEEECKSKAFFSEVCEEIINRFFRKRYEEETLDEERNVYVITKTYCFACYEQSLEEGEGEGDFHYSSRDTIYSFYINDIAKIPNVFYKYALINAIAKKVKKEILTKINQEPEKFLNYKLYKSGGEALSHLLNDKIDNFDLIINVYDEKVFEKILNEKYEYCTITLTYDGEEYTHEKW